MNITQFFEHWSITENPFRGEEARNDEILARLNGLGAHAPSGTTQAASGVGSMHSDFEKILGEMTRPSTSVVFGEKGSGKPAIRLQIAQRVGAFNAKNPDAKLFLISYDDLNIDTEVAKVSVVGIGMRSHTGVAARMFKALADDNVNIKVIATSEIKISVLIDRKYMELAVQALHDAFGLEQA